MIGANGRLHPILCNSGPALQEPSILYGGTALKNDEDGGTEKTSAIGEDARSQFDR
jgi:hypothetical protein